MVLVNARTGAPIGGDVMLTTKSATSSAIESGPVIAIHGPLIAYGLPFDDYIRDIAINGRETTSTASNGGVVILYVATGYPSRPASQQITIAPSVTTSGRLFGQAVAIIAVTAGVLYELLVASRSANPIEYYSIRAAGRHLDVSPPVVTLRAVLSPAWTTTAETFSLAAGPLPGGGFVAVGGVPYDDWWTTDWGVAFVWFRSAGPNGVWSSSGALKAPKVVSSSYCGWAVAVAMNLVAVGCPGDRYYDATENSYSSSSAYGSAHAWRLGADQTGIWSMTREAYLKMPYPTPSTWYGASVAAAANATHELIVVGAPLEDTDTPYGNVRSRLAMPPTVAGSGSSGSGDSGAVFAYVHPLAPAASWRALHRFKAPYAVGSERFGFSVSAGGTATAGFTVGIGAVSGCRGYLITGVGLND